MSNFAATLNSAPAYVVNDVYKRFINPEASDKKLVGLSRTFSLLFLVVGVACGLMTTSITSVMMWLVGALSSGFVAANVLKWYWWRFNGFGYFWGMISGIVGALLFWVAERVVGHSFNALYTFPFLLLLSLIGCLAGTFLSHAENEVVLKRFYKTVNPWGWWGPIREKVVREDPSFVPNHNAGRDLLNVAVGIVWQLCLVTLPIYLVLRQWNWSGLIFAVLIATSVFIKFSWYDRLEKAD
jgi:MFS family permease